MFTLSKLLGPLTDTRVLAFAALICGTMLLWTPWRRLGRALVSATVAFALVLSLFPIGIGALAALEERFPPPQTPPSQVDGVIVLGGDFDRRRAASARHLSLGDLGGSRLIAFAGLARDHPNARLVFSGGSGSLLDQDVKEATGAANILRVLGLPPARVLFEDKARNTYENAALSLPIAKPRPGETWVVVTSASHMPRAIGCFRAAGWTAAGATLVPYPVDFWTRDWEHRPELRFEAGMRPVARATHEWLGLAVYYALGRTDALFPAP